MIPISWSDNGIPFITIRINNQTEQRALDTASGSNTLVVYDPNGIQGMETTAQIDLYPVDFSFSTEAIVSNTVDPHVPLTVPIQLESEFIYRARLGWFTITPQGFYPLPRESMRANRGQFCENPNEAVLLVAGVAVPRFWNVFQMNGDVVMINSLSRFITLGRDLYPRFMDEVREILSATNVTVTTNTTTHETIIHDCNIPDLDNMLPDIEFVLASVNPQPRASWFIDDAIPHYVRISPKDYLFMTAEDSSSTCNLGILPSNNRMNELGTALFKSHSVSFFSQSRSVIICQAAPRS